MRAKKKFKKLGAILGFETSSHGHPFRQVLSEGKSGLAGSRLWAGVGMYVAV